MLPFTDQTGHIIRLASIPRRIVSLVPSQTELLFDLGLNEEVVGITKFCIHPQQWFHNKTRVGGTKQVKIETVKALKPDLILANKEENVKEQIEELSRHYPVWTSDIRTIAEAYEMITQVGAITGKERNALALNTRIRSNFARHLSISQKQAQEPLRTVYLIWQDPYMTVGGDTFIHAMMEAAGLENIFSQRSRYPEVRLEEIKDSNTDMLLLSSEPFPFRQKHIDELKLQLPGLRIALADGEMFSWYGSRMQYAPGYFLKLRKQSGVGLE